VEVLLASTPAIEPHVAAWLREQDFMIQFTVAKRGSLTNCFNPSTALKGRIRDAGVKTGMEVTAEHTRGASTFIWDSKPAKPNTPPDTSLLIPHDKIAGIIGRQGALIHQFWQESGVQYIEVKGQEVPDVWPEMRFVHIWGTVDARHSAIEMILNALVRLAAGAGNPLPPSGKMTLTMMACADQVSGLGADDSKLINKIHNDTGVWIDVSWVKVDGADMCLLLSKGTIESLGVATWEILRSLEASKPPPRIVQALGASPWEAQAPGASPWEQGMVPTPGTGKVVPAGASPWGKPITPQIANVQASPWA